jgi:23S rRNA pseudouridine1911/1915/1917 synthase
MGIKLTQNNSNICILDSYSSVEELLIKELLFSKSFIKKNFKKNFLAKEIRKQDELFIPIEVLNKGLINPSYSGPEIVILEENDQFIIVNKPSGIHGHPQNYLENNTVLNFLRNHFNLSHLGQIQRSDESTLLYRLDKETSGVLFFSKDSKSFETIRSEFSSSAKTKEYLAIVRGDFSKVGVIENDLKPFGEKGSKMIATEPTDKSVQINVKKISYNNDKDLSLLMIKLGKGARHQIRSQLSGVGFPILGDTLYGGEKSDRLYLHAFRYSIILNENEFSYTSKDEELFLRLFDLNSCTDVLFD